MPTRSQVARRATVVAAAACALAASASVAAASGGGSSYGGARYVAKPQLTKVSCVRRCASRQRAKPGSTLRIVGRELGSVRNVTFHGSYGRGDDASAPVRAGSPLQLGVRVPLGAVSGPISVRVSRSLRSRRTRPVPILPPPPPEPNPLLTPVSGPSQTGAPRIETGTSRTRVFYGARRVVTFSYRLSASAPASVLIELVSATGGPPVASWTQPPAQPGQVQSVVWDGKAGGVPAHPGRYSFRLTARSSSGAVARSSGTQDYQRDAFDLYDHVFPIRGRHDYGGAGARFGAGRHGHSHQGQDVFARCGTRLVAARGGRVQYSGYHRAAGYYIVVDGAGTSTDYGYMHLAEPSPFRKGDRVYTGQRLGAVGDSGNARGCHLHFEIWRGPGWYEGGHPLDPLSALMAWDSWS